MAEDYGYDLIKTSILAGAGIFVLYYISKFFELRNAPIILGNKTEETATQKINIVIPEIWIPYQPGDSKDSVVTKLTPSIGVEGYNWILQFKPVITNIAGINTTYTPPPVKIPVTSTLTIAQLATRLIPEVQATANPVGWNIKFAPITILA